MLLRTRQKELVERAVKALHLHGNTLAVAPTGAGKTIMLSATIGELCKSVFLKTCVLAHRDELTVQNEAKFCMVNPHIKTSVFDASVKSWQGNTTFAMVQTLTREVNLKSMPMLDLLVIDEAHHARADSYRRIVDHAKALNPNVKLLGMTATPNRGDKKGLHVVFSNVCDQITIKELIASGHLVRPRTFVMDVGARKQLEEVKKTAGDYDMEEVSHIMNTAPINTAVVAHWLELAENRQTVVFCSTVHHARNVLNAFLEKDIASVLVHGEISEKEREQALKAYTTGQAKVIVNVAVLAEGWDHPPTSCIVLLRPSSYKSTFIQMIGRGLRTVNEEDYPGLVKTDCLVLDFGTATLAHGSLEQTVDLDDGKSQEGASPSKSCPECKGIVPIAAQECPLCGYAFPIADQRLGERTLAEDDFIMREVNILKRSNFLWVPTDNTDKSFIATGFEAWGGVFFRNGQWHAIGSAKSEAPKLLAVGEKATCLAAADDWMNVKETDSSAYKARQWLTMPATDSQLKYLPEHSRDYGLTRYQASALMTFKFNAKNIRATMYKGASL